MSASLQSTLSERSVNPDGPTLDDVRARAQREADQHGVAIVIGWQINHDTGLKEYGYCPETVAPDNVFVLEVLETLQPYTGGRASYAQRQETRRDRLETAAQRAAREAASRFKSAHAAVDGIPFGQPILVGHHSERHHRAALKRHDNNMRAGIDAEKRAHRLASRASSVGEGGISSDDPAAVAKLREELAGLKKTQDTMKAANAIIRRLKSKPEACIAALCEAVQGLKPAGATRLMQPDDCGRIGFAGYQLSNNSANMRRIEKRIAELLRVANVQEGERAQSQSGVVFQVADNRVQLVFPGKPEHDIRARLKSHGFRWAPSVGAWQRHLNDAGVNVAQDFIAWLDREGR